ncbi:MAG: magnesium/cobalt transporter CorA [Acidobacteria bacterium]|nr:magnesium/cobalt transporter CorA [Acidobacteriota bacterium]
MVTVYVHARGRTSRAERVEPAWLDPSSGVTLWVDLAAPTPEEGRILADDFRFHPLSVEDALSAIHHPKIETYQEYLYLILHSIDFQQIEHRIATHDVDFFLGRQYLVTVHDGRSRSIARTKEVCERREQVLAEGPVSVLHRIVDHMVESYRPEIEELEEQIDQLEDEAVLGYEPDLVRRILEVKRDLASLRRVVVPQRDAVGRLARREFAHITDEMAYRFRDVYDQLVRLSDEATLFHDRVTGILEAHLSATSNRLNVVMKVLTVISTIFLPLTVLTGMWGMNIPLPAFPGGAAAQFWWIGGCMAAISGAMLLLFWRKGWI